jgi:hypothetical protein
MRLANATKSPAQVSVQSIDPDVDASSQWEISPNGKDIIRKEGNIGINTVPTATLDVNGKIKTKKLQISTLEGFVVAKKGEITTSEIQMSDISDIQMNEVPTEQLQVLGHQNNKWFSFPMEHYQLRSLDQDDHQQYFNKLRHKADEHNISSLNVKDILVVNDNVQINAPLIVNDVTFNKVVNIDNLRFGKSNGVLYAKNGKVETGVTTTDIPEGANQYFTNEKVIIATQNAYLSLDGSNLNKCTGLQQFIKGLDADKLDGKDAENFATNVHEHNHDDLGNISADDHHPQNHSIINHIITGQKGQIFKLTADNVAALAFISIDDIPNKIPMEKIGNGNILESDLLKLTGIKANIQEQFNQKTNAGHKHSYSDLTDVKEDIYTQYLNQGRANVWLSSKTTDDISEGTKKFYSDDKVINVSDKNYLKLDGTNIEKIGIKKLPIDVDKLGGLSASDFANSIHSHSHKDISDITPDSHHFENHSFLGTAHDMGKLISRTFLTVDEKGQAIFQKINIRDLPNQIPADLVSSGKVKNIEFESLSNVNGNIQEQLNGKSILNHNHSHCVITDRDKDDHPQYFDTIRLTDWINGKTSDNLQQGTNNLYVNTSNVLKALVVTSPLIKTDLGVSLKTDGNFIINGDILSLCQDINPQASVGFAEVKASKIIADKIDVSSLNVKGKVAASSLDLDCLSGVLYAEDGAVKSQAKITQLADVEVTNPENNHVIIYKDGKWVNQDIVPLLPIPMVQELKQEQDLNIVVEDPINVYAKKSIGIGVMEARAGLDVGINKIIGGPEENTNILELCDSSNSVVFTTGNKSKLKFSSNDNDASLHINTFKGISKIVTNAPELRIQASQITFGKNKSIAIIDNGYVGIGTTEPLFPVDMRGVVGISNNGQPANWLMFRTDIEAQNPLIAFPQSKELMIGTYDQYSTRGIWRNIISIGGDGNIVFGNVMKSVKVIIDGEIINKIKRYEVTEQINNLVINSNIAKFTKSEDSFIITGIAGGIDGKMITLINGTDFEMIIKSDDSSSIENHFDIHTVVASKSNISVLYDDDVKKWVILK